MSGSIFLQIRIGGFRRIENSDSLPGSICGDGGFDATTGAAGDQRAGSVSFTARPDHRHEALAGEACALGRLEIPGSEVRCCVHRWLRPAAVADPAGLAILKHTFNLSDEVLCELWLENPYYQYFCDEEFFQHELPFERSSISTWRKRMGEERLRALLQESLAVATRTGAMKPADLSRVIVDTTVQPKNITFPTDAKLVNRAREKLVKLAKRLGVASVRGFPTRRSPCSLCRAHNAEPTGPAAGRARGCQVETRWSACTVTLIGTHSKVAYTTGQRFLTLREGRWFWRGFISAGSDAGHSKSLPRQGFAAALGRRCSTRGSTSI